MASKSKDGNSKSSSKPWSLLRVFAPTIFSMLLLKWGVNFNSLMKLSTIGSTAISRDSQKSLNTTLTKYDILQGQYAESCPTHLYKTNIFTTDPLIIYVEEYLSQPEIDYLLNLAFPLYQESPVSKGYNLKAYDKEIRSSKSAVLPNDPVVRCIEERSVEFQGFMPKNHLEDIQVVKYAVDDHFRPHFDVSQNKASLHC
jgi:prolyl 4-hydroxylase